MRALIYSIIASVLIAPVPVYADPVIVASNDDTRINRTTRDRRHWQDIVNDSEWLYRMRNNDGRIRIIMSRPYVDAGKPQAEVNCKYVERIDMHGERSFYFICP